MAKKVNTISQKGKARQSTLCKLNERAYTVSYANKVAHGFCESVCKGRCCVSCEHCDIEQARKKAIEEISRGERIRPEPEVAACYGAYRSYDGKGHLTVVMHC